MSKSATLYIVCDFPMLHACCKPVVCDLTYSSCVVQFKCQDARPFKISTRQNLSSIFGLDTSV